MKNFKYFLFLFILLGVEAKAQKVNSILYDNNVFKNYNPPVNLSDLVPSKHDTVKIQLPAIHDTIKITTTTYIHDTFPKIGANQIMYIFQVNPSDHSTGNLIYLKDPSRVTGMQDVDLLTSWNGSKLANPLDLSKVGVEGIVPYKINISQRLNDAMIKGEHVLK